MRAFTHHWILWTFFLVGQFGFDFGDIGAFLEGLLSSLISFLIAVLQYIWAALIAVANFIFTVLQFVWKFLVTVAQDIYKGLKWVWDKIIKVVLPKLVKLFQRVRKFLRKIFTPILNILQGMRDALDQLYKRFVKPILNFIQNIRKFLVLFRLLGFKWAKKLDALLGQIQADILKAYELLRQNLNKVISFIQILADATGILRRNPLFGALIKSQAELRNLTMQSAFNPLSPDQKIAQQNAQAQATAAQQKSNYDQYYSQGTISPDDQQTRQDFSDSFDALYNG